LVNREYLFSWEFKCLPFLEQANAVLDNLELLEPMSPPQIAYLATPILRAYCGCDQEPYFDELSNEWVTIEQHDKGCMKKRWPICEDLSESTMKRRLNRERMYADMCVYEEDECQNK
jgi:hypothetical protein